MGDTPLFMDYLDASKKLFHVVVVVGMAGCSSSTTPAASNDSGTTTSEDAGNNGGGGNNGGPVISNASNSVTYTGTPVTLDSSIHRQPSAF